MRSTSLKLFFFFLLAAFLASCSKDDVPNDSSPPTDFHGIPPDGIGGDSLLNIQKNRWLAPQSYAERSLSDIINLPHDVLAAMGARDRRNWTSAAADQAKQSEKLAVTVTAYLIADKEEGNESCNGNNPKYHDFHLWIADSLNFGKDKSLIAEAIPYWQEQFSKWLLPIFDTLAVHKSLVRISGRVMWDEDHPDDLGKYRGSLWEIHPMTKFEYSTGSEWHELALGNMFYRRWNYAYIF
jgi:hypothetical protein